MKHCLAAAAAAVLAGAQATTTPPSPAPAASDARTAAIVERTCGACHTVPPPDVLPRRAWSAIALDMTGLIVQGVGLPKGRPAPSADFDFEQIAQYYERRAPVELPSPAPWPAPGPDG